MVGTSQSDRLISYPGYSLVGSYSSAEMQLVYSTAPANWAREKIPYPFIAITPKFTDGTLLGYHLWVK